MKKKLLVLPVTIFLGLSTSSCKALHVHDYSSPFYHDETSHWQICSKCKEKINYEVHAFNMLNDTCITCKYVDPLVITNEDNHVIGLTKHGLTKAEVSIPKGITFIENYAFKGSQAVTVNLTKDIIGIYKDAFAESNVSVINTEEEIVHWVEYNGIYYKDDVLKNYQAMINNKCYSTLKEAIEAVKDHNTTITLLKNIDYSAENPLKINYQITFESYQPSCDLKANFYIKSSGSITIPTTINYQGNTTLEFGETDENINGNKVLVYNTGSLIFPNRDEEHKPENINVVYYNRDLDITYEALGSVQMVNEALVVPKPYYAFGVFKLSKDLKNLIGLTSFGETVMTLNVTNVIKEQTISVNEWAFTTPTTIVIHIPVKDIKIHANMQKGFYRHVVIGSGVDSIGSYAFSNYFDHTQVPRELLEEIKAIICPLTTLELGDSVKTVGYRSFYYCAGLKSVVGGINLETISHGAFDCCYALKTADFSKSVLLKKIDQYAFSLDDSLNGLMLPSTVGWKAGDCGFLPNDLTSEKAGHLFANTYKDKVWERNLNSKICYYNPNEKDGEGRCNKVHYTETFKDAYDNCVEGGNIIICDPDKEVDIGDVEINKSVNITSANKVLIGNVTINEDKYLTLGSKIAFKENSTAILKHNIDGTLFKNVGGLALEKASSNNNDSLTVKYKNGNTEYPAKACTIKLKDENIYNAYGMFDFNLAKNDNADLTIRWLSALGQNAVEFEVNDQLADKTRMVEVSNNVDSGEGAFKEHHIIRKVTFGDSVVRLNRDTLCGCDGLVEVYFGSQIKYIGRWAFCACKNLSKITFSNENTVLAKIDEAAFNNCSSLENFSLPDQSLPLNYIGKECFAGSSLVSFDFTKNNSGWKHGDVTILDDDLKDKIIAAQYLKTTYSQEIFTR